MIVWRSRLRRAWKMFDGSTSEGSAWAHITYSAEFGLWKAVVFAVPRKMRRFKFSGMPESRVRYDIRSLEEAKRWCETVRRLRCDREHRMLPPRLFTKDGTVQFTEAPYGARGVVLSRIEPWRPLQLDERGIPHAPRVEEIFCEGRRYACSWELPEIGEYVNLTCLAFVEPGAESFAHEWMTRYLEDMRTAAELRSFDARIASR